MSRYTDAYKRLFNRAVTKGPIIIFWTEGKLHSLKTNDSAASKLMDKKGVFVLGVYDKNCEERWLVEDLLWLEQKKGKADVDTCAESP